MNLNKKLIAISVAGIIGLGGFAQAAVAATGNASAVIVAPISFTENTALNFGTIENAQGTGGATANVVVAADKTVNATATTYGTNLARVGTTDTDAKFTLTGGSGLAYTLTLPGSATLTGATFSDTMSVGSFASYTTSAGAISTTGTLTSGSDVIYIGATLTVKDQKTDGTGSRPDSYSGTYTVTAAYN